MPTLMVTTPYHGQLSFNGMTADLDTALTEAWNTYNRSAFVTVDGVRMTLDLFMGGWLLDNCPLNVIFGQGWISGQQEALTQAGRACSGTSAPTAPTSPGAQMQYCIVKDAYGGQHATACPPGVAPGTILPLTPPASTGPTTPPDTVPAQHIMASQTPPPMGSTNSGVVYNIQDTQGGLQIVPGTIYRLILQSAPGRVDTGATYPLCSRSNTDACQPIQFASVDAAVAYANAHNETPVMVHSVDEVWAIVEGRQPVDQANIIGGGGLFEGDSLIWIAAAVGAFFILPKLFKKGKSA